MHDIALARALHVIGVVLWIGGVAMVTMVLLPAVRNAGAAEDRIALFEELERRFGMQARVTTVVTGLSGFYIVHRLGLWPRFAAAEFWWMHAMVAVWLAFTLVLFVLEPLVLHAWFRRVASTDAERALSQIARFHWVALLLSLATIAGATAGSHGLL